MPSSFVEYVLRFYGAQGIYNLSEPFTQEEVERAMKFAQSLLVFEENSFGRELVRDIIKHSRGVPADQLQHEYYLQIFPPGMLQGHQVSQLEGKE